MGVTSNPNYKELADSPIGRADFDGGNELRVRAKNRDAAKFRVGGPQGGTFSCDVTDGDASDPNCPAKEVGYLAFGLADYTRDTPGDFTGMVKIVLRDESIPARPDGNEDPKEVTMLTGYVGPHVPPDQAHLQLHPAWATALAALVGTMGAAWLAEGNFRLHIQGDGNLVVYDTHGTTNPAAWTATFNLFGFRAWQATVDARLAALGAAV